MARTGPVYRTQCPNCGDEWVVLARHLGSRVACRECNTQFRVPNNLQPVNAKAVAVDVQAMSNHAVAASRQRAATPAAARRKNDSGIAFFNGKVVVPTGVVLFLALCMACGRAWYRISHAAPEEQKHSVLKQEFDKAMRQEERKVAQQEEERVRRLVQRPQPNARARGNAQQGGHLQGKFPQHFPGPDPWADQQADMQNRWDRLDEQNRRVEAQRNEDRKRMNASMEEMRKEHDCVRDHARINAHRHDDDDRRIGPQFGPQAGGQPWNPPGVPRAARPGGGGRFRGGPIRRD